VSNDSPRDRACALCGDTRRVRAHDGPRCATCGWRVGDVPDPELPLPRVEVVYYIRFADRVKIGTSSQPRQRLATLWHEELLAFERGGRTLEQRRHAEFADLRLGGEWFRDDPRLREHIHAIRGDIDPWDAYARWFAEALNP
jgi:hypothetical protein